MTVSGKSEPAFLLNVPDHVIEKACAVYWNAGVYPEQIQWAGLVEKEDHRVPGIRLAMHAALSAAALAETEPKKSAQ